MKCREWHGEEFHDVYISPHIIWVIKSRIKLGVGKVAHMGIILKWLFKK